MDLLDLFFFYGNAILNFILVVGGQLLQALSEGEDFMLVLVFMFFVALIALKNSFIVFFMAIVAEILQDMP